MDVADAPVVLERRIDPKRWPTAIAACNGPQIVVGGPGTGKTEFLVRRVLHLIEERRVPASELIVLSFGRRGTADLEQRIRVGLSGSVPRIAISTFHSLAARIVESHASDLGWQSPPRILTGPEQVELVQRLLAGCDRSAWSPAFRGLLGSSTFAREVTDFLLRAREQMLSGRQLHELAEDRHDWRGLPAFIEGYDSELRALGRIDYGTLLASAVQLLERHGSAGTIVDRSSYVLVDEYQDTTVAQARLLESMVATHTNLTVAADPYQSIYSFRGADLDNVDRFPAQFRDRQGNAGKRIVLTTSFRTPKAILNAAVRITSGELPGAAGTVTPAPSSGRVDVYLFDQETEEAEWVADEMQRLHLEEGMPYARMGVFVRSKRRFLPDLFRALDRRNMPHDSPDARLSERSAVRFVLDLVAAATGSDGPGGTTRAVRRILLGPLYTLPLDLLRRVERHRLNAPGGSWAAAIRAMVPGGGEIAQLLEDDRWATLEPAGIGLWHVWNHLSAISAVVLDPDRADEREAWSSLDQVLRRWNERNPEATLVEYRRLSEEEEFEARPLLSYRSRTGDRPTITTLHQSKGLEFDVVFIADAVEGVFPDLRTRDSLLGVRHLMTHLPGDAAAYRVFRLQEERRLAYTAMSRARTRVIWTATSTGSEHGRGSPSRFLALVAGTATVAEAVRRDTRLRDPLTFAGMRRRGSDTGVMPSGMTLSPSQAESYDACPRRYALERRLRIGATASVYIEFGSLIHHVLEMVERTALETGERHGTLEKALEALGTEFDASAFGGPPFSDAWFERAIGALEHIYQNWPSPGSVVAVEHPLELELGGVAWFGRIDRIEVGADGLMIVDYKTSRTAPRINDIAESLQLGFYVLAAAADSKLKPHGSPLRAEMWYPAAGGKSVKTRSLDLEQLATVEDRLIGAATGILAEDWEPRPGDQCNRCSVRPLCPAWLEGREAFV